MSKKPDKRIQAEYDRIAKGPHTGWFTLLHHGGPVLKKSHNIIERLNYIVKKKPEHERLCRLINIVHVPEPALAECEKVRQTALAACEKVRQTALAECEKVTQTAWAEYEKVMQPALKKLNPRTTWNGKTIFSGRDAK